MKKFWNFIKNEDTSETELLFNGPISEDTWWGDEVTPALFRDELSKVSGNLTVWLNSPGGDVFAASQIYSMLKNHKGKVTVKIDGIAASAASVVAMAGDETLIAPTAMMMIHDPSTSAMGNKADMEKAIELLEEVKESIINAYETKSHLSRNKIAKLMSDETWLNAKKAHEMGFVDRILFAENKKPFPPEEGEEEPDEDEKKEDTLTAMTYSKSKNLSAFLSKVSASAEPVKVRHTCIVTIFDNFLKDIIQLAVDTVFCAVTHFWKTDVQDAKKGFIIKVLFCHTLLQCLFQKVYLDLRCVRHRLTDDFPKTVCLLGGRIIWVWVHQMYR